MSEASLPRVLMYSTAVCPYCVRAENLLRARGVIEIEKVRVDLDPQRRVEMMERTQRRTVPPELPVRPGYPAVPPAAYSPGTTTAAPTEVRTAGVDGRTQGR